jgi:hypothetical protein
MGGGGSLVALNSNNREKEEQRGTTALWRVNTPTEFAVVSHGIRTTPQSFASQCHQDST